MSVSQTFILWTITALSQVFLGIPLFLVSFDSKCNTNNKKIILILFQYNGHNQLSPCDVLFHSFPVTSYDHLSTSCPLISNHTFFSPWLFQLFANFLSLWPKHHVSLPRSSADLTQFLHTIPVFFRENIFLVVNLGILRIMPIQL